MNEIQPVLFEAKTRDGPEFVAAYPVGELMVHRELYTEKWAISHAATGYGMPFVALKKSDAIKAAEIVNSAEDWSVLRLGIDGVPEWNGMKDKLAKAAKDGWNYILEREMK